VVGGGGVGGGGGGGVVLFVKMALAVGSASIVTVNLLEVPATSPSNTQWSKLHPDAGVAVICARPPALIVYVPVVGFVDPDPSGACMVKV